MTDADEVTRLLRELTAGRQEAYDDLLPRIYEELRHIAGRHLRGERPGHTLGATALVHEAYLRLIRIDRIEWQDRNHFFALASRAMRRVLIHHAEARKAQKRGGDVRPLALDDVEIGTEIPMERLLALEGALRELEALDERLVRVVECRFFGGMTVEETAEALGTSPATVKRDWTTARAWLNRRLATS